MTVSRSSRILVVDDEPGMLRAVERVLSGTHHVVGTHLSREALAVAAEFHPELAIVDVRMPDLDGFELMAQLKTRFPDLDVILMTGSVDDLDLRRGFAERRADIGGRTEQQATGAPGSRFGGRGGDFGQAAIGAERVYRDCCDGPSEEPPSATTWRPP